VARGKIAPSIHYSFCYVTWYCDIHMW